MAKTPSRFAKEEVMEIATRTEQISGDGAPMTLYIAEPKAAGKHPVVIVFFEAFGLNGHIKHVTDRFAQEGYLAVCPDMYYRMGPNNVMAYNEIPKIMPIMQAMYDTNSNADTRIVIDHIKGMRNANAAKLGTTGYCMGGTLSWLAACLNRDVKAAACYYSGGLITRQTNKRRPVSPHDYAELTTAAILGLYGENDQNPPAADVREVYENLKKLGKTSEYHIYPGAGHGFTCDERPSFQKASSDDAWKKTFAWFDKYLKH
ncbi:MAG: dienelactone hydrolase family protein [Chloroflexi bacterium]|nr:dienelactone hydrolase family protein [Chloroflexota bacterium]